MELVKAILAHSLTRSLGHSSNFQLGRRLSSSKHLLTAAGEAAFIGLSVGLVQYMYTFGVGVLLPLAPLLY